MTHDANHTSETAAWWLTVPEVCALLSISPHLWERWCRQGSAPEHTTGADGVARVHRADLTAWLDHQRTASGTPYLTPAEALERMRHPAPPRGVPQVEASEWLTVPQLCAELHVTPEEWQQWRADGEAPPHRVIDGTAYVRRADFDAWFRSLPRVNLLDLIDPDDLGDE